MTDETGKKMRILTHDPSLLTEEVTESDRRIYERLVSTKLTNEQREELSTPPVVYPQIDSVMAIHWHPEYVPLDIITKRVRGMFPNSDLDVIIPTQHNDILELNGYAGLEIDCYARPFNRKVQLLLHFRADRLADASAFRNMVDHTFRYRSGQLYEFLDTLLLPRFEDRILQAAATTGADEELIRLVRIYTRKLKTMIDENYSTTPRFMLRNKLVRNYFNSLRETYDDRLVDRAQFFLRAVKTIVKANFSPEYFYATQEIIEEARSLDACIIVPHPEQFWPILLADYDVDGYEVWNPQSREFTEFLIHVVVHENARRANGERKLLVMMGDDCHMGEKLKPARFQDEEKYGREVGYQPAWDDPAVRKSLIRSGIEKRKMIEEYRQRLG